MLRNYFKIALRVFQKHKLYTLINVGGLTIGLAAALLIFLWLQDEKSVDQFHEKNSQLYSVIREATDNQDQFVYGNNTPGPLGPALIEEIPEIENACRITYPNTMAFSYQQIEGVEVGIYADPSIFSMFSFEMLKGSKETALDAPNKIVISETIASKYFKDLDPIGEAFTFNNGFVSFDFEVSGVMENPPKKSTLQFDFVIPFAKYLQLNEWAENWGSSSFRTLVQLNPQASLELVNQKIDPFFQEHHNEAGSNRLFLIPFSDGYLYGDIKPGREPGGRITYVKLFSWIAVFILLIACINFMNLATARAGIRTKEVGVRKVIGACKKSLVSQFMMEALVLSLFSMGLAVLLAYTTLPVFNQLTGKSMVIPLHDLGFLLQILGIVLITGFVAGSYPALFLSSFDPASVLKGKIARSFGEVTLRKVLVVGQFVLTIILLSSTLVIFNQINYIQNMNLGMDRENVIYVNASAKLTSSPESIETALEQHSSIKSISFTSNRPSEVYNTTGDPIWEGMKEGENLAFRFSFTGHNFIKTMGIELKSGRDFSKDISLDTLNYILNETAVSMMNLSDPLGKSFDFWGRKGEIIGIVKDFHHSSLHGRIEPFVILLWPENTSYILVKVEAGQTPQALASLETAYKQFVPDYPFQYSFLDDDFERVYKNEMLIGKLANYFTAIVIIISCLGLFGLASFTAERKTKEIGIRKVLGASVPQIISLISKDFVLLVSIAMILASPVAWYLMDHWLDDFHYKIVLEPWLFLLAGLASLGIALLTVGFQAVKAGLANPVDSLRNE